MGLEGSEEEVGKVVVGGMETEVEEGKSRELVSKFEATGEEFSGQGIEELSLGWFWELWLRLGEEKEAK